jgi:hypothetical protein
MTDYTAKIAALEEAAGSGELTIKTDGREVTYRDMNSLLKALAYFQGRQAAANGVTYAATLYSEGC